MRREMPGGDPLLRSIGWATVKVGSAFGGFYSAEKYVNETQKLNVVGQATYMVGLAVFGTIYAKTRGNTVRNMRNFWNDFNKPNPKK